MHNFFQNILNKTAEVFGKDVSKMLIWTGVIGWATSALAQIGAIMMNPKISDEKKSFLIPQEFADMCINVTSFFLVTLLAKKTVSKLFTTGKFAPKSVREYLDKNKDLYKDKIGKLDFNLDSIMEADKNSPQRSYLAYKNIATTAATIGGGIVSSNIITPIVRNKMASNVQKQYIEVKKENPELFNRTNLAVYQNRSMKI